MQSHKSESPHREFHLCRSTTLPCCSISSSRYHSLPRRPRRCGPGAVICSAAGAVRLRLAWQRGLELTRARAAVATLLLSKLAATANHANLWTAAAVVSLAASRATPRRQRRRGGMLCDRVAHRERRGHDVRHWSRHPAANQRPSIPRWREARHESHAHSCTRMLLLSCCSCLRRTPLLSCTGVLSLLRTAATAARPAPRLLPALSPHHPRCASKPQLERAGSALARRRKPEPPR